MISWSELADRYPNRLVLILAACFGLGGFLLSRALFSDSSALVGTLAPSTALTDIAGTPIQLAQFRGKPVVVNFWATWCPPCIKELPMMDRSHRTGKVEVITVATDDPQDVREFLDKRPFQLRVVLDQDAGNLASALSAPSVIPYTVFIDTQGKISSVKRGALSEQEYQQRLVEAGAAL